MRLLTPFIPFTMDEVYHSLNFADKNNVQLLDYPTPSNVYLDDVITDYETFINLRNSVLKKLEEARSSGLIGSSQEATIALNKNNDLLKRLKLDENASELARLFVVSKVVLSDGDEIVVRRSEGEKCPRCWNYVNHLHNYEEHNVCQRCLDVLKENK